MHRRHFLRTAGLAATGSLLAKPDHAQARPVKANDHVLILGSGLAGLGAAHALHQKNIRCTVLEARSRPGGRVFTHTLDDTTGMHVELGAEWVGASHERLIALCKSLDIRLLDHTFQSHVLLREQYYTPRTWPSDTGWQEKYQGLLAAFRRAGKQEQSRLDRIDWWRYLVQQGIPERELELRELNDSTDFGETIRNVSAFSGMAEYADSSPNNEMDFKMEGGNRQVVERLIGKIGLEKILFNKRAVRVSQTGGAVEVLCADGTRLEGSRLICTLPAMAVLGINWQPALPAAKTEALQQLQYARITKSSVLFRERFWHEESLSLVTDALPHFFFHTTKNQPGPKGVLTSYAIGDKAHIFAKLGDGQKMKQVCETLKPAFGDGTPHAEKVAGYYWADDPHTHGAYAIYDVTQWFGLREAMGRSHGHVLFAGEHLADWQGFMEGALQTGQDAAQALL